MSFIKNFFAGPEDPEFSTGQTFLVAGLGNPGKKYVDTRHNIGFMAIDLIARETGITLGRVKNRALIGDGRVGVDRLILVKPQTFMNASGDAVGPLANFYKVSPEQILIIYDELDLPLGTFRLREKGSAGGHNGMRSIIHHLGQNVPRIRLGIGRPKGKMPPRAHVLQKFGGEEVAIVQDVLDRTVAAVDCFVREGVELTMSRYNGSVVTAE